MSENISITCPGCKNVLELEGSSQDWAGQIECPECKTAIVIPGASTGTTSSESPPDPTPLRRLGLAKRTKRCPYCGEEILETAIKCKHCHSMLKGNQHGINPPVQDIRFAPDAEATIRRLADYQIISGCLWMCLGIGQLAVGLFASWLLSRIEIVGGASYLILIPGIWNIIISISRFAASKQIRLRLAGVPAQYEGIAGLIVIGLVNFFLGAFIGVILIIFDFVVRDRILKNRHLFTQ